MILTGSTIGNIKHARQMAAHLFKDENEKIIVEETIGGGDDRKAVENGLVEMQMYTRMTRGDTGIFHVAISPREHESLTPEQQERSLQLIEKKFSLEGQTRMQVSHIKDGRKHTHVFWSMVDQDDLKLKDIRHYKLKLQDIADQMDREFEHEQTPRRPDEKSIEITNADRMQDGKKGKGQQKAQGRKEEIGQLWRESKTGQEFLTKARAAGYEIAKGDKAAFALLDRDGVATSLARDLPKLVKTQDVRERLGSEHNFPSVAQARENQKTRLQEKTKPQPEYEYNRDAQNAEWEEKVFQAGIDHDKQKTQEARETRQREGRSLKELAAKLRQEKRHKTVAKNREYFEFNNQKTQAAQEFNAEAKDGAPNPKRKTKAEREKERESLKELADKLRRSKRHEKARKGRKKFEVGKGSKVHKEFNAENDNEKTEAEKLGLPPDAPVHDWKSYKKAKKKMREEFKDKEKGQDLEI